MTHRYEFVPVGTVVSTREIAEDDNWDSEHSRIELSDDFDESALLGLGDFSHCLVVYLFDRAAWDPSRMSRHPRGNTDWPRVGIFAQRAKDRPNRIGVTTCRIIGVQGTTVHVHGLDAIDGTPVLDIKPYMVEFDARGEVRQPAWSTELMNGYWSATD